MTTIVLGLDGASFDLLDPWLEDGSLPTIRKLVEGGVATDLQSCLPPVTCPNWQCYATGTNPGKLGVFWWERIDAENETVRSTSSSHDFHGEHYWNLLDGEVAIVNLPTSYPPPDIDGVHVAGGPGAENTGYTSPPSVEKQLDRDYGYTVHPPSIGELTADRPDSDCVDEIYDLIETRFDVLEQYVASGEYEFVHATVFYINVLQHFFWDHDVVKRGWELIDRRLGSLLEADELDDVFVMSDHGSNEIALTFHVNAWLEREGYLVTDTGVSDVLHRFGLTRERVRPVLARLGIEWWLRSLLPRRVQTLLPTASGDVSKGAKGGVVDWDESVALASGQGPVYVLASDPDERARVRDELVERLDGLTHDGREVIESAEPVEDVYDGPHLDDAPDIVLDQAPGIHIEEAFGSGDGPFRPPTTWRGENKDTGLFVAFGPDIDDEASVADMHILDIAPTVLHLRGEAVPDRMDGTVRTELFAAGSDAATRDVRRRATDAITAAGHEETAVDSEVDDRLSDLGYLS